MRGVRFSRAKAAWSLERGRVGVGRVEAGEARGGQSVPRRLPLRSRRLQLVAERHQFIDLGDDAVLFGEGWERYGKIFQLSSGNARKCDPSPHADYSLAHAPQEKANKPVFEPTVEWQQLLVRCTR